MSLPHCRDVSYDLVAAISDIAKNESRGEPTVDHKQPTSTGSEVDGVTMPTQMLHQLMVAVEVYVLQPRFNPSNCYISQYGGMLTSTVSLRRACNAGKAILNSSALK